MDDEAKVERCRFAFECTKQWGDLSRVQGQTWVRYCATCETAVHYCTTAEAFDAHAAKGHCVALGRPSRPRERPEPGPGEIQITLGVPAGPER